MKFNVILICLFHFEASLFIRGDWQTLTDVIYSLFKTLFWLFDEKVDFFVLIFFYSILFLHIYILLIIIDLFELMFWICFLRFIFYSVLLFFFSVLFIFLLFCLCFFIMTFPSFILLFESSIEVTLIEFQLEMLHLNWSNNWY